MAISPVYRKKRKLVNNPALVKIFRAGLLHLQWIRTWQFGHLCGSRKKQSQKTAELLLDMKVNCIVSSPRVPAIDTATAISEVNNFLSFLYTMEQPDKWKFYKKYIHLSILVIWDSPTLLGTIAVDSFWPTMRQWQKNPYKAFISHLHFFYLCTILKYNDHLIITTLSYCCANDFEILLQDWNWFEFSTIVGCPSAKIEIGGVAGLFLSKKKIEKSPEKCPDSLKSN